jgi:hypothetical protein
MRFLVEITRDDQGRLEGGTIAVDPAASSPRVPMSLFLAHPAGPDEMLDPEAPGFLALTVYPKAIRGSASFSFRELLGGSSWGSPP